MHLAAASCLVLGACAAAPALTQRQDDEEPGLWSADTFAGFAFRCLGPALTSGRISDIVVDPANGARWFVAVASGGVWRTENAGITWTPVFDQEKSFSIGCLAMDPRDPFVIWVGAGENNSQRSVAFGDGVYKSVDGGAHWENVGLKASEHIGKILIDPRDSGVVFVAAQGPLWAPGGDRGLYKTTDGGKTWRKVLDISENTGVNEVHCDPRDPHVMYASAYQRRRHVWTLIDGGPECAIYKSEDGGETWRKLEHGLPKADMGRIGLAVSPADPDVVYAIIEAAEDAGGFFRSTDRGETWERRSEYMTTSPQYYNELVADPENVQRVFAMDTRLQVTEDGGKTFRPVPDKNKHVDNHAMWIDPQDNDHWLVGCDGGVYQTWDRGASWGFVPNLPVTQFYRVSVGNEMPFYWVYGGTQDNNSLGAPSRTLDRAGIASEDWFVTVGGDGYETLVDPVDSNLLYAMWQYGGLVRYDRRSGEVVDIKPRELPGEEPYRWNWDSPLILSPHAPHRLYFAANRLFRSDDRGSSWRAVSGDLTRRIDRNQLPVMGRIWEVDAVAKSASTSFYGNCVALAESPLVEGLIYVGTDDGLIHATEDGGATWRRIEAFPGVPERAYVSRLEASQHSPDRVYAAFDNHKNGDFKPYILRSDDRGRSWTAASGDLPEREVVYALAEDHVKPDLLFAGTAFGAWFSANGGTNWIRLEGGIPTIEVRDLAIQERENDLALATFGRGIYVLDDYSPLRLVSDEVLQRAAVLFPVKDALLYVETSRLGGNDGRGSQGASYYAAPNPPFGAVFTYYLREKLMSRKERRNEDEKKARKEKRVLPYPTWDELRAEDEEVEPEIVLVVQDDSGAAVRRLVCPRDKGFHRVAWDLRYPPSTPVELKAVEPEFSWEEPPRGPLAAPGTYTVTLAKKVDGALTTLAGPERFEVAPLGLATLPAADRPALLAFQRKVAELHRAVRGALAVAQETDDRLAHLRKAALQTPGADPALLAEVEALRLRLRAILAELRGDETVSRRNEPTPPSIQERVENVVGSQWLTTAAPSQTEQDAYLHAGTAFARVLAELRALVETDLRALEARLEAAGAPWTPGRVPDWRME